MKLPTAETWPEMVALAEMNRISRKRLAYYKEAEVARMKSLDFTPDLLLLHDWPAKPAHVAQAHTRRPEAEIVAALRPAFVCCGHHHTADDFMLGTTRVLALNIISTNERLLRHIINPGWCALFEWGGQIFEFLQTWPTK